MFSLNKQTFPFRYFFPIQVPMKFARTVFSTIIQQMGDRSDLIREHLLGLQCLTMIFAICVVEYASTYLTLCGIVSLFLPECTLILRRLLVHQSVSQWHPWPLLLSFVTQTNPIHQRLHKLQSRLLQCHLGTRLFLCTSEMLVLTPRFWDARCPSM